MRTPIFATIALFLMSLPARADTVSYHGSGDASGMWNSRNGSFSLSDAPASLALSYTYDAGLVGVTTGGTTTFTIPTLDMEVDVPGAFSQRVNPSAGLVPGTISWTGDTITFHDVLVVAPGLPPSITIDLSFTGSPLTPGVLPSSLSDLHLITGGYSITADPTNLFHGDLGSVSGSVVSIPEPSSALLLALGLVGLGLALKGGDTHDAQ